MRRWERSSFTCLDLKFHRTRGVSKPLQSTIRPLPVVLCATIPLGEHEQSLSKSSCTFSKFPVSCPPIRFLLFPSNAVPPLPLATRNFFHSVVVPSPSPFTPDPCAALHSPERPHPPILQPPSCSKYSSAQRQAPKSRHLGQHPFLFTSDFWCLAFLGRNQPTWANQAF